MKKSFICILITFIMLLSFSIVSCAAYLGDVNNDGKITAADARTILRASAKLEKLDTEKSDVADLNGDGKITASDARTVLRMSAKLEQLQEVTTKAPDIQTTEPSTREPDTQPPVTDETTTEPVTEESSAEETITEELTTEEPITEEPTTEEPTTEESTTEEPTTEEPATEEPVTYPESIKAFMSGKYYIFGKTSDGQNVKLAVSGENVEVAVASGDAQLSLLKKNSKTYLKAISADGEKYYVTYTELMKELFGADFEALTSRFDFSAYSERNEAAVKKGNDENSAVFSFADNGSALDFYVENSAVVKIEKINSEGEVAVSFDVDKMSKSIPSGMLNVNGFTATQISNIPYIVPEFLDDPSVIEPEVKTYPKAIKVFLSGKYHMSGTLYDGGEHSFGYTYNGEDKAVVLDGVTYYNRKGLEYLRNDNAKIYAMPTEAQMKEYGIDFDKVMKDNTFALEGKTECIAFEKSMFNELPCDIYTLRDEKGNVMKFTIVYERLARIAVLDEGMNEVKYIITDVFDDDIPDGILTLVGYKKADISKVLG